MIANCQDPCRDLAWKSGLDAEITWAGTCLHRVEEVVPFLDEVGDELLDQGYSLSDCLAVRLALQEAVLNGLRHGNEGDPTKCVWISYHVTPCRFLVEVADEGAGFDPNAVSVPTLPENQERPGGLGIRLMRHFMTWVRYSERGNRVTMYKRPSR